ncbi:hypothetical protein D3C72_2236790 [compost metagenome]
MSHEEEARDLQALKHANGSEDAKHRKDQDQHIEPAAAEELPSIGVNRELDEKLQQEKAPNRPDRRRDPGCVRIRRGRGDLHDYQDQENQR